MIKFDQVKNIFSSSFFNKKRYFCCFGSKILGDGRKIANIFNFLKKEKLEFKKIIIAEQIHSANVAIISHFSSKVQFETIENVDGLVTNKKGLVLVIRTADCLPIIYIEERSGVIAISHNGWRGTLKKISKNIIEKMLTLGADINQIKIALGPAIGACCYQIDEDRYWQFKEEFDGYSDKIFTYKKGWHLNLTLLNYLLLQNFGIKKENIDYFPFCTFCDKKRFYSFRRDKKKIQGEMFNLVVKL